MVFKFGPQLLQVVVLAVSDFQVAKGHLAAKPLREGVNQPGLATHASLLVLKAGEVSPALQNTQGLEAKPRVSIATPHWPALQFLAVQMPLTSLISWPGWMTGHRRKSEGM